MSVTMTRGEGVTVLTLTSDPQSSWPPICQIFKGLCYSPTCCSVSQHLRKVQGSSQSVLGALHIMGGMLHIGLGAILTASQTGSWFMWNGFPFWMGALFILFGVVSILSERFPSPCLVILNEFVTLSGVASAIAAIILYSLNIANIYFWWSCREYGYRYDDYRYDYRYNYRHHTRPTTTTSPEKIKCLEAKDLVEVLLRSINALLIILSVLQLCLSLSSAILGIKALHKNKENKSPEDLEQIKPLLEEVTSSPSA